MCSRLRWQTTITDNTNATPTLLTGVQIRTQRLLRIGRNLRFSEICGHSGVCAFMTVYYRGICWFFSPKSPSPGHTSLFSLQMLTSVDAIISAEIMFFLFSFAGINGIWALSSQNEDHSERCHASAQLCNSAFEVFLSQLSLMFTQTWSMTASAKTPFSTASSPRCPSTRNPKMVREATTDSRPHVLSARICQFFPWNNAYIRRTRHLLSSLSIRSVAQPGLFLLCYASHKRLSNKKSHICQLLSTWIAHSNVPCYFFFLTFLFISGHTKIGYSIYFYSWSSMSGRIIYMEDLYVMAEFRGIDNILWNFAAIKSNTTSENVLNMSFREGHRKSSNEQGSTGG